MRRFLLGAALAMTGFAGAGAQAPPPSTPALADEELEVRTVQLASQLRCVVCQGQSLQDSPSELAQQMRALVKEQLAAGKSPEEVKAYFVAKYGEWILLEPQAHGFNYVAYVLPPLVLIVGGVLLTIRMRRWAAAQSVSQ